jgi:hypothetical protein
LACSRFPSDFPFGWWLRSRIGLNLTIFSQGNSSVELYKSHIKPSQVSFLVGRHWLFSSLIKKIADKRSRLTVFDHKEHESKSDSTPQSSSKWKITRKPLARQNVTIGLRLFPLCQVRQYL